MELDEHALNEAGWMFLNLHPEIEGEIHPALFDNIKALLRGCIETYLRGVQDEP